MKIHTLLVLLVVCSVTVFLAGCTANPQDLTSTRPSSTRQSVQVNVNLPISPGAQQTNQPATQPTDAQVQYTLADVSKHSTQSDCWMVINGKVLDLSSYTMHPGGDTYVPYCGTDGTTAFNGIKDGRGHSDSASRMAGQFVIGTIQR